MYPVYPTPLTPFGQGAPFGPLVAEAFRGFAVLAELLNCLSLLPAGAPVAHWRPSG